MRLLPILIQVVTILYVSEAKIFKRCEFVHQLEKHGVPDWQIPTLTCLAKWESSFDSGKLDYKYGKHGIFQINEKVWCSPYDYPGRECETTCSNFRDKHLADDIACALKIYKDTRELSGIGYDAWDSYWEHCASNNNLAYLRNCD
ncbi:lysozyme-like [Diorhabda carinulata]|uniref:lysozyme-like n=1 Tax=Diorhabda carinulata TaxID=1163345 RepID=UPI0025A044B1|nr:lysozyme-like [Diorhabda carinulata]